LIIAVRSLRRSACLGPAILVLCAPLSAQENAPDLRRYGWQPHPAQAEYCSWRPERLPSIDAVLDPAAIVAAASGIAGFEDEDAVHVVSLSLDSAGAVSSMASVASSFPAEREVELIDLILPHVRPRPSDRAPNLRVGVFGGAPPAVTLGPALMCVPYLANRATVTRLLSETARDFPSLAGTVTLWIFVQTNGVPGKIEVKEVRGVADLEAQALKIADEMRFLPARRDGVPVEVWASIPLTFR
jgi:TonB family protein